MMGRNPSVMGRNLRDGEMTKKPVTDSFLRTLKPTSKKQRFSLGNFMFVEVLSQQRGGTICFVGRMRFPPTRSGKLIDYHLGTYGKGSGQLTLKQARDEWERVRTWSKDNGKDPRELKKERKKMFLVESQSPPLIKVCEGYFTNAKLRKSTIADYQNIINNQVLPVLGSSTSIEKLSWDNGGREVIIKLKKDIERRGSLAQSDKVLMVIRQVFGYAIDMGWLKEPNPAMGSKFAKSAHKAQPNPCLEWEQLPDFFEAVERNEPKASMVVIYALKLMVMTFLRVGALCPARWDEIDYERQIWSIPDDRMKVSKGEPHVIPLTAPIIDALEQLKRINGDKEYIFFSPRGRKTPYISTNNLNQLCVRLGYKSVTTAHGFRAMALTAGQEQLGYHHEVIQRQLAHAVGDKVRQAYDRSKRYEERRKFMVEWCDALVDQGLIV
jgi:integrase